MIGRRAKRGFTLVEMMVAMAIMGIVMSLAALEFKYVVYSHLFAESHLSSEQQARIAMAKIGGASRQASVVDSSPNPLLSPKPAIIEPAATPGPRLVFTQAASLDPAVMPSSNGVPQPCYNTVQLYLDKPAADVEGKIFEQAVPVDALRTECTATGFGPLLLVRNVQDFVVQPIDNSSSYGKGYRIDLSIFDYDDHQIDSRAGALYHLSTVISPLEFGAAQ